MPKCKIHRHELFAQGIVKGLSASQAYRKAGYVATSPQNAHNLAGRCANLPEVKARIEELNAKVERKLVMDKSRAVEMLSRGAEAAFALMQRAGIFRRKEILIDPKALEADPELKLAVREVTITESGDCKIKLHDYKEALALLAKLEGWEAPKALDINTPRSIKDMTDEQLAGLAGEGAGPHAPG
jgi:hypothetical protein